MDFGKILTELRQGCQASRCDYVLADTSRPLGTLLTEWLDRVQERASS
jgi:hypothetical protein